MSRTDRIPPELLRKVRAIEISTRHLVDDLFGGEYHSVFKGSGMEFDEVREYQPGDEVRTIDWNVTARMGRPFIKRYREERELTVMLLVDASASGRFGSGDRLKSELIAELGSVLAFSAIRNQDKVGCLIFTDRVEKIIPPAKGQHHVLRIIRELLFFRPAGRGTDIGLALETVRRILKRRSVLFLVSDFLAGDFETPLRLTARRHDLIAFRIEDRLERDLPAVGLIHIEDSESGERFWVDSDQPTLRQRYRQGAARRRDTIRRLLARNRVDEITLKTDEEYVTPLVGFFRRRMKRLARGFRHSALLLLATLTLAPAASLAQSPPQGQPQAMPQQASAPQLPITPRARLDEMEMPNLDSLTAAARPRLDLKRAGDLTLETRLARDLQTIGDPNRLSWRLPLDDASRLTEARWRLDSLRGLLPLAETSPADPAANMSAFIRADTLAGGDIDTLLFTFDFTFLAPDTLLIPGAIFTFENPGGGKEAIRAADLRLEVMSVLALHPDSSALRDWKAPGKLATDWRPLLAWLLPSLLLLALAAWLFARWRRGRKKTAMEAAATPPDEEALAALSDLAAKDLPGQGAFHAYYFNLSLILRRYLGRRYQLPVADWTTEEIRDAANSPTVSLPAELATELIEDLERADGVKFARRRPTRGDCDRSLAFGRRLVRATSAAGDGNEGRAA